MSQLPQQGDLARRITEGDRRALARGITLVESTNPDHAEAAANLLNLLLSDTGGSIRLGVSGAPGVGKSTFIEALGIRLIESGHRVAVLAVDPSSARTGGSILGDKTRMGDLVSRESAFVRPSPSGGALGGVARKTADTLLLCEAAGYDVVIVETVGVGQSETAVADITDLFLLLLAPGGGDDLQGIKRGIMELADVIAVNKADGDLAAAAKRTASDYRQALSLVRSKWPDSPTEVLTCSSTEGTGIEDVWDTVEAANIILTDRCRLEPLRASQRVRALRASLSEGLVSELIRSKHHETELEKAIDAVKSGKLVVSLAVESLIRSMLGPRL